MLNIVRSPQLDEDESTFERKGVKYEIDFSYDNVLRFYKLLEDKSVDKFERIITAFRMLIGNGLDVPFDVMADEVVKITDLLSESPYKPTENGTKVFDYEQDSEAIYASFLKEYGIDLIDQKGKLNYFKFQALLNNLSSKAPLSQIISIRTENPAKHAKDDPDYAASLNEMQQSYALNKTPEELQAEREAQMSKAFDGF